MCIINLFKCEFCSFYVICIVFCCCAIYRPATSKIHKCRECWEFCVLISRSAVFPDLSSSCILWECDCIFPVVVKWKWRSCMFTMLATSPLAFWSTQMVDIRLSYLMSTWQLTWQCIHITVMRKTGTNNTKEHLLITTCNLLEERSFLFAVMYIYTWICTI
jgi:hypothetical protein